MRDHLEDFIERSSTLDMAVNSMRQRQNSQFGNYANAAYAHAPIGRAPTASPINAGSPRIPNTGARVDYSSSTPRNLFGNFPTLDYLGRKVKQRTKIAAHKQRMAQRQTQQGQAPQPQGATPPPQPTPPQPTPPQQPAPQPAPPTQQPAQQPAQQPPMQGPTSQTPAQRPQLVSPPTGPTSPYLGQIAPSRTPLPTGPTSSLVPRKATRQEVQGLSSPYPRPTSDWQASEPTMNPNVTYPVRKLTDRQILDINKRLQKRYPTGQTTETVSASDTYAPPSSGLSGITGTAEVAMATSSVVRPDSVGSVPVRKMTPVTGPAEEPRQPAKRSPKKEGLGETGRGRIRDILKDVQ